MKRIRLVELEIAKRYNEGKMRCPTHLSIGQEAVGAGVGAALNISDTAVSGHRAHAHYLGKGGDLKSMIAEIYGKVTGCSSGKGGSMHLIDETVGFMGSTAIVGGTVPIGVGIGYGIKIKNNNNLSCIFIGDAVIETGVFFESVNFAALKKLPVLFICENNKYSVYTSLKDRQPLKRNFKSMIKGLGIKAFEHDGNDVEDVFFNSKKIIKQIKDGSGPAFIEFKTYRWLEHCGPNYDNNLGYRSQDEFLEWKSKDPVKNYEQKLLDRKIISYSDITNMNMLINKEIQEAFDFADKSPYPSSKDAYQDLYHNNIPNGEYNYG